MTKAVEYFEKADKLGSIDAAYNLGYMHHTGKYPGKERDMVRLNDICRFPVLHRDRIKKAASLASIKRLLMETHQWWPPVWWWGAHCLSVVEMATIVPGLCGTLTRWLPATSILVIVILPLMLQPRVIWLFEMKYIDEWRPGQEQGHSTGIKTNTQFSITELKVHKQRKKKTLRKSSKKWVWHLRPICQFDLGSQRVNGVRWCVCTMPQYLGLGREAPTNHIWWWNR